MHSLRFVPTALIAALLTLLSSCSSDRLWRISPLERDASRDRVNLWPIAYHDRGATSVLWPFFDVDNRGFALRPLVAKDGPQWSALWPLASWNTDSATGWAGPIYRFQGSGGLFPVARFGDLSYVGPLWWRKSGGGKSASKGIFPIAYQGKSFGYFGPVWWNRASDAQLGGGLFPVATFGDFSYVGPAWWTDEGAHGLFPIYGSGAGRLTHVGPIWWSRGDEGVEQAGLFPLLWSGDAGKSFGFLPFYWHRLSEGSESRSYLLGLGHSYAAGDRRRRWLMPLYFQERTGEDSDTVLFPLFWKRQRGDSARVQTLLGSRSVAPNDSSFNVYPLWWSSHSEDSSWKMLAPLFYYAKDGDDRTLITPLGGRGWSASGDSRYVNFLGPLYHHSESADGSKARTAFLWPLFEQQRDGDRQTTRAWPFFDRSSSPGSTETSYALGLGHAESGPGTSSFRLWPFYSRSTADVVPDPLYSLTLAGSHTHAGVSSRRLFPIFTARRTRDSSHLTYLLFFGDHQTRGEGKAWRLWPLASSTQGMPPPDFLYRATLFGRSQSDSFERLHVGTPLLYYQSKTIEPYAERSQQRLLTFFVRSQERRTGLVLPSARRSSNSNLVSSSSNGFLFDALVTREETFQTWRDGALTDEEAEVLHRFSDGLGEAAWAKRDASAAAAILNRRGFVTDASDPASVRRSLRSFADANTVTSAHSKQRLPLLYGYERRGDELEWSGPLWLIHSKSKPEHKKFSLGYYLYRSETKGTSKTRDIFPFITWDTAPQKSRFSFLWRVFRYERDAERRGGHVFFVPWGDA